MSALNHTARYDAALSFLYDRIDYERSTIPHRFQGMRLDRMRDLLNRLGQPHASLKIVHVAGTKGKGSTSAMIASVLSAAGYRTGLYTSPHLERLEERIALDGHPCSMSELCDLVDLVRPAVEQMDEQDRHGDERCGPTFFEITTAMTMCYFVEKQADVVVLEVGLGGRLDSTNVCQPLLSVITSISFDHMRQLGNTLAEIAGEKAGIIKPGVPVISGVVAEEPRTVIECIAHERQSPLYVRDRDFGFSYQPTVPATCDYWEQIDGHEFRLNELRLAMLGRHQAANCAVAIATLRRLQSQGWDIPESAMRTGLAKVRCPARVELLQDRPAVIVDAAHNVASAAALIDVLREAFPNRRRVLIFAAAVDKDIAGMLRLLLPEFDRVILTRFQYNPRSTPPQELLAMAKKEQAEQPAIRAAIETMPDTESALSAVRKDLSDDDVLCATGSFFLAAEVRRLIGIAK